MKWFSKEMTVGLAAAAVMVMASVSVQAGDWKKKAELTAGGDAKEVAVNVNIKSVMIRCMEGSVIINTVVVREGDKKTPHKVGRRLNKGEDHIIEIGASRHVTGLRISDDAKGIYRVFVRN